MCTRGRAATSTSTRIRRRCTAATACPSRTRIQIYDAPFGLEKTDSITLHYDKVKTKVKKLPGNPVFDDTQNWFDPVQLDHGVKVRDAGVRIEVTKQKKDSMTIRVTS